MIDRELGMVAALCVGLLLIGYSLWKAHRSGTDFNLFDLLLENGKVSKMSFMMLGAFAATTWAFVFHVMEHKGVDAAVMGAYGGLWVLPLLARFLGNGASKPEAK